MATGKDTVCTSSNGTGLRLLQINLSHGEGVSLNKHFSPLTEPFMKHSVHAIPHQSRPIGARQLPPGGSQGGWYEFARDFIKPQVPAAKPLSQPLRAASSPFRGAFGAYPTSPERGGGPRVSVAVGFAVRRIPFGMHQGEFAQALSASPGGKLAALTALRNRQG